MIARADLAAMIGQAIGEWILERPDQYGGPSNRVYEWPDDEAAAYRDNGGFREGIDAVQNLRQVKAARAVLAVLDAEGYLSEPTA